MTAERSYRIESRIASSSAYFQIVLEYRKPTPAGTADIAFSEALAYPTVQSEVGEFDIMFILQLSKVKTNRRVRKHKEKLPVVAKTEMCILEKEKRRNLPSIPTFLPAGE